MHLMINQVEMTMNGDEINDSSSDGSRRNKQNTFSWSSTSSTYSAISTMTVEEPTINYSLLLLDDIFLLDRDKKQIRLCQILSRSASIGDIETIIHIFSDERLHNYLDINIADEDGSTPLIYASCFGKLNVVKYLLEMNAKVDVQDKIGWTALMWATTNGHSQIVELLLEYSASSATRSASGRTIYDLVDTDNEKMISILSNNTADNTLNQRCSSSNWRKSALLLDEIPSYIPNTKEETESSDNEIEDLKLCEASFRSVHKFVWDQCLPDQMFVFAEDEVDHILNIAIIHFKLPIKTKSEIYVPANIIFLCSRFAHYYTNRELVHTLLSQSIQRIKDTIKTHANDIHTLAFWITNLSQLLYYLKKDSGLVVATAEYQLNISELIAEAYTSLIVDSEKRLDRIVESAMLEYEQLGGLEVIDFADDWHRFFRRNRFSISNNRKSLNSQQPIQTESAQLLPRALSPQLISSLLTSTLYVLQSYEVHPVIIIQAMAQIFHFLSCEIFNRILTNKKYLCRSKALQIRMNLTVIEEWVRENRLPLTLANYFHPVIQLLQLLQCVSQLSDLMEYVNSTKNFDLLNPMQIKRVVLNYRYEVTEPRLPEEIEKYTMQIAEDTLKSIQQQERKKKSTDSYRSNVGNSGNSRPNSISSLGSLLLHTMSQTNKRNRLSSQSTEDEDIVDSCSMIGDEDEDDREWLAEKRDSKYMLPFSLPTTSNMILSRWNKNNNTTSTLQDTNVSLSDSIYTDLKQKMEAEREKTSRERSVVPSIPEDWLLRLDHHPESMAGN